MKIQMANSTLEALGIADLDVTSADFSLDAIDKALKTDASKILICCICSDTNTREKSGADIEIYNATGTFSA